MMVCWLSCWLSCWPGPDSSPVVSHCLIDMRGRVVMGRRKGERRLVDPVFKMADASMADFIQTENFENRPFHRACINRKLPCPNISCRGEAGKVFFEEKGLAQHFRAKHVGRREEIYSGSVVVV